MRGGAAERRDEGEKRSVGGCGAEREVGEKEGVIVKDGEGGKERVWDVERSGGDEDLEVRRGGSDGSDGVFMV